jgi:S-DNA-T family DNA segregation ATPase FtsK/SpoIIIE
VTIAGRQSTRGRSTNKRSGGRTQRRTSAARRQSQRELWRDGWGVALLILAPLAALGLYAHEAGLVGSFLELLFRGLFGVFGLLAPPALAAGGVLLLKPPRQGNLRVVAGWFVTAFALAGLWHLAQGAPLWSAPPPELHAAAGWFGATAAVPLLNVAEVWGAVVVLVGLVAVGVMLLTATPPRAVAEALIGASSGLRERVGGLRERAGERRTRWRARRGDDAGDADHDDTATVPVEGFSDETAPIDAAAALPAVTPADADADEPELVDTQLLPRRVDVTTPSGDEGATRLAPPDRDDPWGAYELPPIELLRTGRSAAGNKKSMDQMRRALERTMAQFNVDASVSKVLRGPTVTRFEVSLGTGVKVAAVTRLSDDISYALATPEIRIVAPIPGKSAIGIEVPNRERDLVTLGDVLRSPEAANEPHPLAAGIGVDISANPVLVNLATMPHLLIAGATGSGKSVTMNSIVTSVIMRSSPAQVRMILVDPKRVELSHYEGAPHLLTPVITDPKRATEALQWTVEEMESRYEELAQRGYRNVDSYNAAVREGRVRPRPLLPAAGGAPGDDRPAADDDDASVYPYLVFVIDELADLMMVAPRDVESHIVRIAQMARAVGIHLVVATQRPSVDVVTGLIKANVPSRIAMAMATQADSRTILDQGGAEKLVGDGDMLFMPANASKPHRLQGCFIGETEVEQVIAYCKSQRAPDHVEGIVREGREAMIADVTGDDASDTDLVQAARELVVRSGLGSTSMLQRKLKVGFARAGRIMDELEEQGVVGPSEGSKARQVLMTVDQLESSDRDVGART